MNGPMLQHVKSTGHLIKHSADHLDLQRRCSDINRSLLFLVIPGARPCTQDAIVQYTFHLEKFVFNWLWSNRRALASLRGSVAHM